MKQKLFLILFLSTLFVDGIAQKTVSNGYTPKEKEMIQMGLVDIQTKSKSIDVHLVYSTPFNFMGKQLYKNLTHALMLPQTAEMLLKAEKMLKKLRPDLSFRIYDAGRPISIQYDMWNMVKGSDKEDFVADPTKG